MHYLLLEFRNNISETQGALYVCTRDTVTNDLMNVLTCNRLIRDRSLKALQEHLLWIFSDHIACQNTPRWRSINVAFEAPACRASKHAVVLHNAINYFERPNWCFQRNRDERYIHIIRFTLTSSLASIHNHGVSNHSLLADPLSLCVMQHMVDIMRFECVQEMKRIYHLQFCWVNTYCSLDQAKWSQIMSDPCALDIPHGASASIKQSRLWGCTGLGKQTHVYVSCLHDKTMARNN